MKKAMIGFKTDTLLTVNTKIVINQISYTR